MFGFKDYTGQSYDGKCNFFGGTPPLPEALGWFIVLGVGTLFALLTSGMVYFSNRHVPDDEQTGNNSETFTAAGRSIPAGLTAADVVSKWTWAATLLQSSNVAFKFGVSGPFWYAAGATVQIILFAILAIEIKRKCPAIHTMLEVVQIRWGFYAHMTLLFFGLVASLIVTAMLILGGAATINALTGELSDLALRSSLCSCVCSERFVLFLATGMDTYAASFLIPIAVVGYTAFGGLKGTYYASYTHTFIIYLALVVFLWKVYTGPSDIGNADKMYDHLPCAADRVRGIKDYPTGTNSKGTFLTFRSGGALIFGIANVVGNFGTVFADQSYWQGAIACKASATWKGYLLGGVAWFAIPFCMATTFGLAARALDLPITIEEAGNGLVPPAVATHLMGKGGAFLIALQLFMAVTSTANSEQLAVASLIAYDVYKRYINPNATGKQTIFVSRVIVLVWAIFSGIIATILKELGIGLGWVYMMMGCCIGCAVMPITFALCWKDCTAMGAIVGSWGGMAAAFIGWFSFAAAANNNVISVATLGQDYPLVTGNLLSLIVSPLLAVSISMAQGGQNFDWKILQTASTDFMVESDRNAVLAETGGQSSKAAMDRAMYLTLRIGFGFSLLLIPIWPLLALPENPFSRSYFTFYIALRYT
jgi:Na+/proline symporter